MSYHRILSKLDRALVAYLIEQGAGTAADVYPLKNSADKAAPDTVVATEAGSLIAGTGTYTCQTTISVRGEAALADGEAAGAPRLAADERAGATFDAFFTIADEDDDGIFDSKKIAAAVTAAARAAAVADPTNNGDLEEFTAFDVRVVGVEQGWDEDGAWIDGIKLEVDCAPSKVE